VIVHDQSALLAGVEVHGLPDDFELQFRQDGGGWVLRPPELVDEVGAL